MDIYEILSTEGTYHHLWFYSIHHPGSSHLVSKRRWRATYSHYGYGPTSRKEGRPVACRHARTPGSFRETNVSSGVERSSDPAGRRDASTISATHAAGDRLIYGVLGMAVELNSSNFSQFSSQTSQLQNSMDLPTPWSCRANEGGVLEHLFCLLLQNYPRVTGRSVPACRP